MRISKISTLNDNIFSKSTSLEEIESGNVTITLSDHLPQFFNQIFSKPTCNTSKYGTHAFVASAIASWIFFQKEFSNNNLRQIYLVD